MIVPLTIWIGNHVPTWVVVQSSGDCLKDVRVASYTHLFEANRYNYYATAFHHICGCHCREPNTWVVAISLGTQWRGSDKSGQPQRPLQSPVQWQLHLYWLLHSSQLSWFVLHALAIQLCISLHQPVWTGLFMMAFSNWSSQGCSKLFIGGVAKVWDTACIGMQHLKGLGVCLPTLISRLVFCHMRKNSLGTRLMPPQETFYIRWFLSVLREITVWKYMTVLNRWIV